MICAEVISEILNKFIDPLSIKTTVNYIYIYIYIYLRQNIIYLYLKFLYNCL